MDFLCLTTSEHESAIIDVPFVNRETYVAEPN
jgi:hypothetical protein